MKNSIDCRLIVQRPIANYTRRCFEDKIVMALNEFRQRIWLQSILSLLCNELCFGTRLGLFGGIAIVNKHPSEYTNGGNSSNTYSQKKKAVLCRGRHGRHGEGGSRLLSIEDM